MQTNKEKTIDIVFERPYKKMADFLFTEKRFSLCIGAVQTAKTTSALVWLFIQVLSNPGKRKYLWAAPYYSQATVAFDKAKNLLANIPDIKFNLSTQTIIFPNGSSIIFKSVENVNNIYGATYFAAVIDEATRCRPEVWSAIISRLTRTRGPVRAISNATTADNWFYRMWLKYKTNPDPDYHTSQITAWDAVDAGVLDKEEILSRKKDLPEHIFQMEYEGIPSENGSNPFGIDKIKRCFSPLSQNPPVVYGIDLAKSADWTVILGGDKEHKVSYINRFNGLDWNIITNTIADIIKKTPAVVDATGVGSPVVDELIKKGCNIIPFKFTSTSKDDLLNDLIMAIQKTNLFFPPDNDNDNNSIISRELFAYAWEIKNGKLKYTTYSTDDAVMALALLNLGYKSLGEIVPITAFPLISETPPPQPEELEKYKKDKINRWFVGDDDDDGENNYSNRYVISLK